MELVLIILYFLGINVASIVMFRVAQNKFEHIAFYNGIAGLLFVPLFIYIFLTGISSMFASTNDSEGIYMLVFLIFNLLYATGSVAMKTYQIVSSKHAYQEKKFE